MARFAANLTMLFTELPLVARFAAAKQAGFQGAEVLFPYDHAAGEVQAAIAASGLDLVLINTPPTDWHTGARGFAAVPGAEGKFREGVELAMDYARVLRPEFVHLMSGIAAGPAAQAVLKRNLGWAARNWPQQKFLIEPLNPYDMPGYFLQDFAQAHAIIDAVGCDNLGLQFDAYHAHRITGDVAACWRAFGAYAQHIQFADHPGRHEPGTGEIDLFGFFDLAVAQGYRGWFSAEYVPLAATPDGLGWLKPRD